MVPYLFRRKKDRQKSLELISHSVFVVEPSPPPPPSQGYRIFSRRRHETLEQCVFGSTLSRRDGTFKTPESGYFFIKERSLSLALLSFPVLNWLESLWLHGLYTGRPSPLECPTFRTERTSYTILVRLYVKNRPTGSSRLQVRFVEVYDFSYVPINYPPTLPIGRCLTVGSLGWITTPRLHARVGGQGGLERCSSDRTPLDRSYTWLTLQKSGLGEFSFHICHLKVWDVFGVYSLLSQSFTD